MFCVGDDILQILLKDFRVYGGVIFLDPKCVVIKGGCVEDMVTIQDELFLASLRRRMESVVRLEVPLMMLTSFLGCLRKRAQGLWRIESKISNPRLVVVDNPNRDQQTLRAGATYHESGRHQPKSHPQWLTPPPRSPGSSSNLSRKSLLHS